MQTAKERIDLSNQYAPSCLLVVQWTIPPYSIFFLSSISALVFSYFFLSPVYCNVLLLKKSVTFEVYSHTL